MGGWPSRFKPIWYNNKEIRIVMVGKTGVGKSASANTILGKKEFYSRCSANSVTSQCAKVSGEVDGQKVSVIDTPGLFDTRIGEEKTRESIIQCMAFASPGPHIFLVVIRVDRFTEEEKKTVQMIQKIFGEEADRYTMILFTHGNQLDGTTIEEFLSESKDLQELVEKCNGQYHVFDNNLEDRAQVTELLNKIRNITKKNGRSHYTTEMFQKTERAIEEEKKCIMKDKEEQMQKEQMDLKKRMEDTCRRLVKEAEADEERKAQIMAESERELDKEMKNLVEQQEMQARKEAESSTHLYVQIAKIVGSVLSVVVCVLLA